jgi:hypothetical protein
VIRDQHRTGTGGCGQSGIGADRCTDCIAEIAVGDADSAACEALHCARTPVTEVANRRSIDAPEISEAVGSRAANCRTGKNRA